MQKDLDAFLENYNTKRPHQGRDMKGRTPLTVFLTGIEQALAKEAKKRGIKNRPSGGRCQAITITVQT